MTLPEQVNVSLEQDTSEQRAKSLSDELHLSEL